MRDGGDVKSQKFCAIFQVFLIHILSNIFVVICIEKTHQYIFQNIFYVPWKIDIYIGLEQHQDRIVIYE